MDYLTTRELKCHVNKLYAKIKSISEEADIFEPLTVFFAPNISSNYPGDYCYSDKKGYHFFSIGDRGKRNPEKVTKSLIEISYWIVKNPIRLMSINYEAKNRIKGQDYRRLIFQKELHLFKILGKAYMQKAECEINEILKNYPFCDDLLG